jgi:hypothetical protein
MKKVLFSVIITIVSLSAIAQVQESFNYQVIVRSDGNNPLVSHDVSLRISILKGSISGSSVYCEKHDTATNQFGLVTLAIGKGAVELGDFITIDWGSDSYYLKVEIDIEGDDSYINMGTTQILSVPYSLYARRTTTAQLADTATTVVYKNKFLYLVRYVDEYWSNETFEYWTANNDGTGRQIITMPEIMKDAIDDDTGGFEVTPDRQTIIFVGESGENISSVYSVSIDGTNYKKLFDAPDPIYEGGSTTLYLIATF